MESVEQRKRQREEWIETSALSSSVCSLSLPIHPKQALFPSDLLGNPCGYRPKHMGSLGSLGWPVYLRRLVLFLGFGEGSLWFWGDHLFFCDYVWTGSWTWGWIRTRITSPLASWYLFSIIPLNRPPRFWTRGVAGAAIAGLGVMENRCDINGVKKGDSLCSDM